MAFGRKKNAPSGEERIPSDYYKLHTDAVNDLIHATAENTPEYSKEELNRYRSKQRIRLSDAAKALLLKFWFDGACCFFFFWGIGFSMISWSTTCCASWPKPDTPMIRS